MTEPSADNEPTRPVPAVSPEPPEPAGETPAGREPTAGDGRLRYEVDDAEPPNRDATGDRETTVPIGAAGTPPVSDPPPASDPPSSGPPPAGPPPAGPPPGPGAGYSEYPAEGAFASRYGLVRPITGRYFAGVCAAIGRATNTDPVLWRVLFAVLSFFGGIGLVAYLVGWLLTPAEGDTASPVESLLGRGHSGTSPLLAIVVGVVTVMLMMFALAGGFRPALLGIAVIIGAALLLSRRQRSGSVPAPPWSWPAAPGAGVPGGPSPTAAAGAQPSPGTAPFGTTAFGATAFGGSRFGAPPSGTAQFGATAPAAPTADDPSGSTLTGAGATGAIVPPLPPLPPRPPMSSAPGAPLAPHGPYASSSPYAASLGYPYSPTAPAAPAYPGLGGTPIPRAAPPRPKHPPSALGRITFSLLCLVLGLLIALDVTGLDIRPSGYVAAVVGVVGFGLLVGAWFGRARGLIALGIVASVALGITSVADRVDPPSGTGNQTWTPTTVDELDDARYVTRFGNGVLDLRNVDFTGRNVTVQTSNEFGNFEVLLPPNVDVDVTADLQFGQASAFGDRWDGPRNSRHLVDNGADGEGGGHVSLTTKSRFGNLEVHR